MTGSSVFTYGTLCIPEVMSRVTGCTFPTKTAVLDGYRCCLIKNKIYPAILPSARDTVQGLVHFNVDSTSLQRLDHFEDIVYDRQSLSVELQNSAIIHAFAYVLKDSKQSLLSTEPWNEYLFKERYLQNYLARF